MSQQATARPMDLFSLSDKVVLVTGGAGLYGRQIVSALAGAGATVYVASRNLENIEALAAQHRSDGRQVTALPLDQGDETSVHQLRDEILKRNGQIDVLVNNAVVRPMKNGFNDDVAAFAESMRVNATGLFMLTRAFGDAMAASIENGAQAGGSIINIGSIHGMVGPDPTIYQDTDIHGWYPDYFFHKGGMINFTRFIASYYGTKGIRCNCIGAGGFFNNQPEPFLRRYAERTMLGRLAGDEDLKGIVIFLASDASSYITASNIPVDGGYTAK